MYLFVDVYVVYKRIILTPLPKDLHIKIRLVVTNRPPTAMARVLIYISTANRSKLLQF